MTDLPHKPTLFIDRNSGGRIFRDILAKADIKVVLHDEEFEPTTPDEVWVKEIGKKRWIAITCDARTMKAPLFLAALKRSTARVFILEGLNGASAEGKAQCIIDAYDKIIEISRREPPLFWKINREGGATCIDFKHTLGLLRKAGRVTGLL
jgi:hypothetical protein